jgi:hypothetical protein
MTKMGEDLQILKGKLDYISTSDFELLEFVQHLIAYRVKHFQEDNHEVLKCLQKTPQTELDILGGK